MIIDASHLEEKITEKRGTKQKCTQTNMINYRLKNANVCQLRTTRHFILTSTLMNIF